MWLSLLIYQYCFSYHHIEHVRSNRTRPTIVSGTEPGISLQWRHNEHDGVSNNRRRLAQPFVQAEIKKPAKLRVTGLCHGEFTGDRASNAENVSIWWRRLDIGMIRQIQSLLLPWLPGCPGFSSNVIQYAGQTEYCLLRRIFSTTCVIAVSTDGVKMEISFWIW